MTTNNKTFNIFKSQQKQIKMWPDPEMKTNSDTCYIFKDQQKINLWPDSEMTIQKQTLNIFKCQQNKSKLNVKDS